GLPLGPMVLLTVTGRKSGLPRTMPVGLFKLAGQRYLMSSFGEVNWVRNLRVAGRATLSRGHWSEQVSAVELPPQVAAPLIQQIVAPYLALAFVRPVARSWYGLTPHSTPAELLSTASHHPVFEVHTL